tara:strand:+ start:342 stop:713 length:372 start_codon:yes stop_codon:yes gene_type:complete
MGSANIQAKIKRGLSKAVSKTGSATSELVYLVSESTTDGTPLTPGTTTTTNILLPNAIFKEYDAKTVDVNILAGDRSLVCDNVTAIKQGDTIQQGASFYIVIDVDIKAPTSDVLAYIAQVRLK